MNSANPCSTVTDFNGHSGYRTVEQAAKDIVWLATQDKAGPTVGFYFDGTSVPW